MMWKMNKMKKTFSSKAWYKFTVGTVLVGIICGFILSWIWYFFSLFILGYGDSGPSWVNLINNLSMLFGFLLPVVIGQVIFQKDRNNKD